MKLENELKKLKKHIGKPGVEFDKQLDVIKKNFSSAEDKQVINKFIEAGLKESIADLKAFNRQLSVKSQLADVAEMVSLSYISRKYFNKTRHWLYNKVNGAIVNGKPAAFSEEEVQTLNFALRDISQKIGSVSVSL